MENKCDWCGDTKNLVACDSSDGSIGYMCKDCIGEAENEAKEIDYQLSWYK